MTEKEKGVLQQKTFSIKWKIERFTADCKQIGDFYTSALFPMRYANKTTKWYLKVFPKGENEKFKEYISLFLRFQSDDVSEMTVGYQLSIMSANNIYVNRLCKSDTFTRQRSSWGWPNFIEQEVIKDTKNSALIDDTLTISCKITFDPKTRTFSGYDEWLGKMRKGFDEYEILLEDNCFSDVTFNIQDKKMYLHKAILSCRNTVFKAMFEHNMKENEENVVEIMDFEYDVMKELIRFIYTGKVKNIQEIAKDLLIAADKYSIVELKALCEKTLYDSLTVNNAIECLKLSDMCDTLHLKKLVIEFIVDNLKDVVGESNFKLVFAELNREVVCEIMQAIAEKD